MALPYSRTRLLLSGDGSNGGTSIIDTMGSPITRYGAVVTSSTKSMFGGTSLYFDGAGSYLTTPVFGKIIYTGEFAIEAFINTTKATESVFFDMYNSSSTETYGINLTATGKVKFTNYFLTLTGLVSVNTGAWVHIAVVRKAGVLSIYVNGVLDVSAAFTANLFPTASYITVITIGAYGPSRHAPFDFSGYIDDLRFTLYSPVYVENFAVPSSALLPDLQANVSITNRYTDITNITKTAATPAKLSMLKISDGLVDRIPRGLWRNPATVFDFKGNGRITGTVAEKSMPANTPLKRLVRLHREPDGLFVQATWSDPITGAYSFVGVRPDHKFFVTSFDYTGAYRAIIADNITPDLIP